MVKITHFQNKRWIASTDFHFPAHLLQILVLCPHLSKMRPWINQIWKLLSYFFVAFFVWSLDSLKLALFDIGVKTLTVCIDYSFPSHYLSSLIILNCLIKIFFRKNITISWNFRYNASRWKGFSMENWIWRLSMAMSFDFLESFGACNISQHM